MIISEAKDWQGLVDQFADVQKLVHLAARMDGYDQDSTALELLRVMRRAFEDELTIQARRVGCAGRSGRLGSGPLLSQLNEVAKGMATSIVATYNYDLATAIVKVKSDAPKANRYVYASRLKTWFNKRSKWKDAQIAQSVEGTARSIAQQQFYSHNGKTGAANLMPRKAVCPVCQGWITRGEVPLAVAQANPPPYHPNCPHYWATKPDKWPEGTCGVLWMGE